MSFSFNPLWGLVIVGAEVPGPLERGKLRLAIDTGAMDTLINTPVLEHLGYDPSASAETVQIMTASRIESAPRLRLSRLSALGHERRDFPVVCLPLPKGATVDGVLGLDFLRDLVLTIDFRKGRINLA